MSIRRFTQVTPPPLRVLAGLGAVVVLLLALVVTAGRAGAAPTPIAGGSIDWGVKASFRGYVVNPALADGTITTGDGATTNLDGTYHFGSGAGTADSATQAIDLSTAGSVAFEGHDGRLDITVSDVRVDVVGTSGTLVADVVSRPVTTSGPIPDTTTYDDVELATLTVTGPPSVSGAVHSFTATATLTEAGVPAFGGFYPVNTALDPVTYAVDLTPPTTSSTSTTSSTVPDGSTTTTSSTVPGESTTTTSSTVPTTDPGDEVAVTGGHLDWGVKESFRTYIGGSIAHGEIATGDGATENADGTFRFPAATGTASPDGESFDAEFGGSVHFTGHEGQLDLVITGIEVQADGDAGSLVADVSSRSLGDAESTAYDDVELAALDLTGVTPGAEELTVTWPAIAAALTEAGVPAFGDFYAAGAALDPLTVVLVVESTTVAPGGGGVVTESASIDKILLAPGDDLTVTGSGFTPGEQVEVWLHSTPQWVGTTMASGTGDVSFTFALPEDLPAGLHHVELRGITSGRILASPEFTVAATGSVGATPVNARGALPFTGSDNLPAGAAGLVLVLVGTGLAMAARRRSSAA